MLGYLAKRIELLGDNSGIFYVKRKLREAPRAVQQDYYDSPTKLSTHSVSR